MIMKEKPSASDTQMKARDKMISWSWKKLFCRWESCFFFPDKINIIIYLSSGIQTKKSSSLETDLFRKLIQWSCQWNLSGPSLLQTLEQVVIYILLDITNTPKQTAGT